MPVSVTKGGQLKVTYRPPEELIPYPDNAKQHTEEQISTLADAIKEFKFDVPIVVDSEGIIIKGHGRREAAIQAGVKKVPVIVRNDLTPSQIRLARISDNKLGESPWDDQALFEELKSIDQDGSIDMLLSGFDEQALNNILEGIDGEVPEHFTPTTEPEIQVTKYVEADLDKTQGKLDKQFEQKVNQTVVACPYCSEEFYIDK